MTAAQQLNLFRQLVCWNLGMHRPEPESCSGEWMLHYQHGWTRLWARWCAACQVGTVDAVEVHRRREKPKQ